MKIRFLFTSVFNIGPKAIACEEGEVMEVTPEDALRLIDGLCAEAVEEEEPPKRKRKVTDGDG